MNTWGRTIEIKTLKGSGCRRDVGAGRRRQGRRRVQGVRVRSAVPSQSPSYADELSQRGVLCLSCGLGVPDATFQDNAPYMWGLLQTPEQWLSTWATT